MEAGMNMPGYRMQTADGSWLQRGVDGQFHPYMEFNVQRDENGRPITDEKGNWQFSSGISTTPSTANDLSFGNQITTGHQIPAPPTQPSTNKAAPTLHKTSSYISPMSLEHPFGREPLANFKEDLANTYDKSSANQQMMAQRAWQEANRDPRNEANKDAQSIANQKFTESQQQMNGSDNTSLVGRQLEEKDPDQYRQYAADQRARAGEYQSAALNDTASAIQWRKTGAGDQYRYRQNAIYSMQSNKLSMGPKEEGEEEKQAEGNPVPQQTQDTAAPQKKTYYDDVSVQDVINYLTQTHWDEISKVLKLGEGEHVGDWWKKSHEGDHTVAQHPELDVPEYKATVEEVGNKLWNGEAVKVGGKEVGGNGAKGVAAYNLLHGGVRGGTGHGYENWKNQKHHEEVTNASAKQKEVPSSTISPGADGNFNITDLMRNKNSSWHNTF